MTWILDDVTTLQNVLFYHSFVMFLTPFQFANNCLCFYLLSEAVLNKIGPQCLYHHNL